MERHLGFAVKIVTICEKKKNCPEKDFFMNLVQPKRFCVWSQRLQQMHGEENVALDQDIIQLPAEAAIKATQSSAPPVCTAPSALEFLIISTRLIAHHLYLSSPRLHSDNNGAYLQVQKQYGAIHGCRCCQPYQLCSSVKEMAARCKQKVWEALEMQANGKPVFWLLSLVRPVKWITLWRTKCQDEKWK